MIAKLGAPDSERRITTRSAQFHDLWYSRSGEHVILMGADLRQAHFAGRLDARGETLPAAQLPSGELTTTLLRRLPKPQVPN